eukprot:6212852-Pleurochrysis_carterae.AAC.3
MQRRQKRVELVCGTLQQGSTAASASGMSSSRQTAHCIATFAVCSLNVAVPALLPDVLTTALAPADVRELDASAAVRGRGDGDGDGDGRAARA